MALQSLYEETSKNSTPLDPQDFLEASPWDEAGRMVSLLHITAFPLIGKEPVFDGIPYSWQKNRAIGGGISGRHEAGLWSQNNLWKKANSYGMTGNLAWPVDFLDLDYLKMDAWLEGKCPFLCDTFTRWRVDYQETKNGTIKSTAYGFIPAYPLPFGSFAPTGEHEHFSYREHGKAYIVGPGVLHYREEPKGSHNWVWTGCVYEDNGIEARRLTKEETDQLVQALREWIDEHTVQNVTPARSTSQTYQPTNQDRLLHDLAYISPDRSRRDWLKVGGILKDIYGDAGLPIWDAWSRGSSTKYKEGEPAEKWKSLRKNGSATPKTITYFANEDSSKDAARDWYNRRSQRIQNVDHDRQSGPTGPDSRGLDPEGTLPNPPVKAQESAQAAFAPAVVHVKSERWTATPDDQKVYIGRDAAGFKDQGWGNPFKIGRDGDRAEVIAKYRQHILGNPDLLIRLPELRSKTLGCWCSPEPCHGDILIELANTPDVSTVVNTTPERYRVPDSHQRAIRFMLGRQADAVIELLQAAGSHTEPRTVLDLAGGSERMERKFRRALDDYGAEKFFTVGEEERLSAYGGHNDQVFTPHVNTTQIPDRRDPASSRAKFYLLRTGDEIKSILLDDLAAFIQDKHDVMLFNRHQLLALGIQDNPQALAEAINARIDPNLSKEEREGIHKALEKAKAEYYQWVRDLDDQTASPRSEITGDGPAAESVARVLASGVTSTTWSSMERRTGMKRTRIRRLAAKMSKTTDEDFGPDRIVSSFEGLPTEYDPERGYPAQAVTEDGELLNLRSPADRPKAYAALRDQKLRIRYVKGITWRDMTADEIAERDKPKEPKPRQLTSTSRTEHQVRPLGPDVDRTIRLVNWAETVCKLERDEKLTIVQRVYRLAGREDVYTPVMEMVETEAIEVVSADQLDAIFTPSAQAIEPPPPIEPAKLEQCRREATNRQWEQLYRDNPGVDFSEPTPGEAIWANYFALQAAR